MPPWDTLLAEWQDGAVAGRAVPHRPRHLLALGIRLMDTWADFRPQQVYKATQFRDGLIPSIYIPCPMRLRNLTEIVIGRHLTFDGRTCRLEFAAAETKAGRP